MGRTLL
jgi:hypothetical protein